MKGLRHLRCGGKLLGIGMLGVALQGGLGSGMASAATVSFNAAINPGNIVEFINGTAQTAAYNVSLANAATAGTPAVGNVLLIADSLRTTLPACTETGLPGAVPGTVTPAPDSNGRTAFNVVISCPASTIITGTHEFLTFLDVNSSQVATAAYLLLPPQP